MRPQDTGGRANQLLAAFPAAARRKLLLQEEQVRLQPGMVLCETDAAITHVYFPTSSSIALMVGAQSHADLEAGLVGNEGMLGATLALGVRTSPVRWIVQGAGLAWRVKARGFTDQLSTSAALRGAVERYLYVTLAQLAQSSICKRFHVVESRLARWLLMSRDRTDSRDFHFTHQNLAYVMGVRRAGITRAAFALQKHKLIRYYRGNMRIIDPRGLELASCGCYAADRNTYSDVMA